MAEDSCRAPCSFPAQNVGGEGQAGPVPAIAPTEPIAMEAKPFLTSESAWQNIQEYYKKNGDKLVIKDLFAKDSTRFDKYRLVFFYYINFLL